MRRKKKKKKKERRVDREKKEERGKEKNRARRRRRRGKEEGDGRSGSRERVEEIAPRRRVDTVTAKGESGRGREGRTREHADISKYIFDGIFK